VSSQRDDQYRVYGYRWVVLAAAMFANLTMQMLWIGYSPIISQSARYYHVSHLLIGLLAMAFMIAFIPLSLPAAWVIDTRGFRTAVGLGVVLMGVFGVARGLAGANYTVVLLCTIGIAVAQPFLLNSWTKLPANWFSPAERATAVGLTTLASMLGIAVGMILSPLLVKSMSIASTQLVYGGLAAVSAVTFLLLARERPATPPCSPGMDTRALMLDGLKHALGVKPFLVILGVALMLMGTFNGVTTWVEDIIHQRGFNSTDAGLLGALMLVAGVIGAVVLSAISDKQRKRVRFLMLALVMAIPGLLGVTFATSAWLLYPSAALLGFFVVAAMPIGMQFAAEVTYPTPEGTSNGLVQLCGQVSVVFVYVMSALKTANGSFTISLLLAAGLLAVGAIGVSRLRDPVVGALAESQAAPQARAATEPAQVQTSVEAPEPQERPAT
jgi:cyanate permease